MIYFDHNSVRYHLRENLNDDSRTVTKCEDPDFTILLRFSSSLDITYAATDLLLGRLETEASPEGDKWILKLTDGRTCPLGVPVEDYNWECLTEAEVEAASVLLDRPPLSLRFSERAR